VAAWSNTAAAVAAPAPRKARTGAAARPRAVSRQRRLNRGIAWIVLLGVLLTGVVALSVGVLRLNMHLDKLDQERTQLRAQNAALQSRLSSGAAVGLLQAKAAHLGLVPAAAQDTTFVQLTHP
jgi:hypothetical protein